MTILLQKAFDKASQLPEPMQDQIAEELLAEIEGEFEWDRTIENSQDKLELIAEKALKDFKSGKTKRMGFDQL